MRFRSSTLTGAAGRGRLVVGLLGLLLSLGYGWQAWTTLPLGKPSQPGAAVFPLIVAVLMAVASLSIAVEEIRSAESGDEPLHLPSGSDLRRLLGVIASLFGYVALASLVGHLIASSLLSLALVHLLKPGSWPRTLVVGLAISLSAYALFVMLLAVPLPKGELGGWDR